VPHSGSPAKGSRCVTSPAHPAFPQRRSQFLALKEERRTLCSQRYPRTLLPDSCSRRRDRLLRIRFPMAFFFWMTEFDHSIQRPTLLAAINVFASNQKAVAERPARPQLTRLHYIGRCIFLRSSAYLASSCRFLNSGSRLISGSPGSRCL
jgi:hypothetical protein